MVTAAGCLADAGLRRRLRAARQRDPRLDLEGEELDTWYARGEAVYPDYTAYQEAATGHGRVIPVFVATPSA